MITDFNEFRNLLKRQNPAYSKTRFLGEVPLVQSIREAGDYGRPAAMQTASPLEKVYEEIARNVVQETVNRNENLAPTEAIKITTMAGCSAVKK